MMGIYRLRMINEVTIVVVTFVMVSMTVSMSAFQELPSYFKVCHQSDPNLNSCLKRSISSILKGIQNGSKELDLASIDPLNIPLLEVKEGTGEDAVTLWMTFKNTRLHGLSSTDIISVRPKLINSKLEIVSKSPFLDITGQFVSDGAVLTFPLSADGNYYINMSDTTAIWILYYSRVKINGEMFLAIDELDVDVIPSSIAYHFGDLLDGDIKLGEAMNEFVNENSHEIYNAIKPKIRKMFKEVFAQIANQIFSTFPERVLLPR